MNIQLWTLLGVMILFVIASVWLFLEGIVNLKTGKVSTFGVDSFFYFIDKRLHTKNSHWDDPKRIRITGALVLLIALEIAIAVIVFFLQTFMPLIKR